MQNQPTHFENDRMIATFSTVRRIYTELRPDCNANTLVGTFPSIIDLTESEPRLSDPDHGRNTWISPRIERKVKRDAFRLRDFRKEFWWAIAGKWTS